MAYRYGNRYQMTLFPQSIEKYVPDDSPVRAYDAFVEALDFIELGIEIDPYKGWVIQNMTPSNVENACLWLFIRC